MTQQKDSRPGQIQTGGAAVGALAGGSHDYSSMAGPTKQELVLWAERYHGWGANVSCVGRPDPSKPDDHGKAPVGTWQRWQTERQTLADVRAMPWHLAWGVGYFPGGASDWRDYDLDHCQDPAPVAAILDAMGLPRAYPWAFPTGNGWRIVFRCDEGIPAGALGNASKGVYTGLPLDASLFDHLELRWKQHSILPPSQHYSGKVYQWANGTPDQAPALVSVARVLGAFYTVARLKERPHSHQDEANTAPRPAGNGGRYSPYAQAALDDELDKLARAPEGTRNDSLNAAAYSLGQLVGADLLDRADVESQLEAIALAIGLGDREAAATIRSGLDAGQKTPRQVAQSLPRSSHDKDQAPAGPRQTAHETGAGSPGQNGTDPAKQDGARRFAHTDLGNAERLAATHGHNLRYCHEWGRWLVWTGRRWEDDRRGLVNQQAKRAVRQIYAEAAGITDEDLRKEIVKWGLRSEAKTRIDAMVGLAQSEPGLPVTVDELDAHPWLLNVANGTVDLRTGALRAHSRQDLITKQAPTAYDPDARCPTWLAFLDTVMAGRQDLIEFLRRAVGYSLTGDVSEQVVFFAYGLGANGKTTLAETITAMLGDYAQKAPRGMLTMRPGAADGVPNDIARLPGARFVVSNEVEEGRRLAEAQVKDLAGGDTLTARFMRGEFFEFRPTHKLWIYGNHKPVIRGTDEGIWRRMRLIPFEVTIPAAKQDRRLAQKLRAELPGILAWAVQGCLDWQKDGLSAPAEVTEATAAYRAEMDVLADFLTDKCILAPSAAVTKAALFTTYQTWCEVNRERPLGKIAFGARLKERGIADGTTGREKTRAWLGVGLLTTPEGEKTESADKSADNADNRGHDFQYSYIESDSRRLNRENASALSALSARDEDPDDFDEGEL